MIAISTLGKFTGPPTRKASAVYGGGTSAAARPPVSHKFPIIRIRRIDKKESEINISITEVNES